jgi:transcriptional regulator with XRE-family HTH domain
MKIGGRVRAKRKSLGLTQKELAVAARVTHQQIAKIESDQSLPSATVLVPLSRTLGVTTDYLLTGDKIASLGVRGEIRAQAGLSPLAKRSLIQLVGELGGDI